MLSEELMKKTISMVINLEQDKKKMVRRMATTAKIPVAPGLLSEVKLDYQRKFKQVEDMA